MVRRDRIGAKNITQTPTLVVGVISPSSRRIDRLLKHSRYAEGGIPHYWVVDPTVRSVDGSELRNGEYRLSSKVTSDESLSFTVPLAVSLTPSDFLQS